MSVTPFKRMRPLIRPVLKLEEGKTRHVRIESKMMAGRRRKRKDVSAETQNSDGPTIVNVINLEDNQLAQITLHAQVRDALNAEYPDDGYIGKCFSICKLRTGHFDLAEIEEPGVVDHTASRAKR
jgi:hypothetical protein